MNFEARDLLGDGRTHFYVYTFKDGRYIYERTCGTEDAARRRVRELGRHAVYLINSTIRGAFY